MKNDNTKEMERISRKLQELNIETLDTEGDTNIVLWTIWKDLDFSYFEIYLYHWPKGSYKMGVYCKKTEGAISYNLCWPMDGSNLDGFASVWPFSIRENVPFSGPHSEEKIWPALKKGFTR